MISTTEAQDRFPHFKFTPSNEGGLYVENGTETIASILKCDDGTFVCTDASDVTRSGFNTLIAALEWASSEFPAADTGLDGLKHAFPMYEFNLSHGVIHVWYVGNVVATIWENSDKTWSTVARSGARNAECSSAIDAVEWATGTPETIDQPGALPLDYFQPGETYRGMCGGPAPSGYDFAAICTSLAVTLTEKNAKYGNSFAVTGDFLRLLWPSGCKPEDFDRVMLCARMFDKMKRLAAAVDGDDEDPLLDLAGYAVLGLATRKS
jgi:hypothetical protein